MADDKKSTRTLVIETVAGLMTAAFGLLAALAWNDAIRAVVEEFISKDNQTLGLVIYAAIVTVIAVIATIYIGRVLAKYRAIDAKK